MSLTCRSEAHTLTKRQSKSEGRANGVSRQKHRCQPGGGMEGRSLPVGRIVNRTKKFQIKVPEWDIRSTLPRFHTFWANENSPCLQYVLWELYFIFNALKYQTLCLLFLTLCITLENKYVGEFTLKSMKLIVYADLATASAVVKSTWIYTSTAQYDSSILCSMKRRDIVASYFQDRNSGRLYTSCWNCSALQTPVVTS